jgi:hypothetical protein
LRRLKEEILWALVSLSPIDFYEPNESLLIQWTFMSGAYINLKIFTCGAEMNLLKSNKILDT